MANSIQEAEIDQQVEIAQRVVDTTDSSRSEEIVTTLPPEASSKLEESDNQEPASNTTSHEAKLNDIKIIFDFLRNLGIIGAVLYTIPEHEKLLISIPQLEGWVFPLLCAVFGVAISLYGHNLFWLLKSLSSPSYGRVRTLFIHLNSILVVLVFSAILLAIALARVLPVLESSLAS
ncbi:hypothetical protein L4D15_23235 [Enterovibrio norvegicus]|uniref:hypothetical protein n=1 Tax=Enterovibrio norvegicus TaxID=188144 RepID=UPI003D0A97C3